MTCSACGTPMQLEARFCSHCGAATPPPPAYTQVPLLLDLRVHRHLRRLGILWMVYAVFHAATWFFALPFITGALGGFPFGHLGPLGHHGFIPNFPFLAWTIPFITATLLAGSAITFFTGYSLEQRHPWGRGLALVMAFWMLIHPFWGTALGIYTLWILMPSASAWEYQQMSVEHGL